MFLYHRWTQIPLSTRQKIAKEFGIKKKGATEVVNNEVKNDGYLIKEIEEGLTILALQQYLETEETEHMILFNMLIEKIEEWPLERRQYLPTDKVNEKVETKKRGRPAKHETR